MVRVEAKLQLCPYKNRSTNVWVRACDKYEFPKCEISELRLKKGMNMTQSTVLFLAHWIITKIMFFVFNPVTSVSEVMTGSCFTLQRPAATCEALKVNNHCFNPVKHKYWVCLGWLAVANLIYVYFKSYKCTSNYYCLRNGLKSAYLFMRWVQRKPNICKKTWSDSFHCFKKENQMSVKPCKPSYLLVSSETISFSVGSENHQRIKKGNCGDLVQKR